MTRPATRNVRHRCAQLCIDALKCTTSLAPAVDSEVKHRSSSCFHVMMRSTNYPHVVLQ